MINKNLCMSNYLAFRFIKDEDINFFEGLSHEVFKPKNEEEVEVVYTANDMDRIIREKIKDFYIPDKTALLLSGGTDSAVLASYLPEKTPCYTFKCIADNAVDETKKAKQYCDFYNLKHEIIEMYWSDFEELTPEILKADKVPFHSIEVQLLKAARYAKSQGIERLIIGESADLIFGGMDKLLSKDWDFNEFTERYTFVNPKKVLKNPADIEYVYEKYRTDNNKIDYLKFMDEIFSIESSTSYMHAFKIAGLEYLDPYSYMRMGEKLDLKRVRNGEPKYMVRDLFKKRYPGFEIPDKIPMPRATDTWLANYRGGGRAKEEFIRDFSKNMTGDQKWLCRCLEKFLDMYDKN